MKTNFSRVIITDECKATLDRLGHSYSSKKAQKTTEIKQSNILG